MEGTWEGNTQFCLPQTSWPQLHSVSKSGCFSNATRPWSEKLSGKLIMQNPTWKQYHHLLPPQMRTRPRVIRCHNLTLSNKNSSTFTAPSSLPLSRFILLPHSTDFRAHAFLHSLKSTAACKISTHICSGISYTERKWCSLVGITCKELSTNTVSANEHKWYDPRP